MPSDRNSVRGKGWVLSKTSDLGGLKAFDCGNPDLNEFFREDAAAHRKDLLAETYQLTAEGTETPVVALAAFCNDAVRTQDVTKDHSVDIPLERKYSAVPAVKIARLGVQEKFQKKGIGTHVLNLIKKMFLTDNRTGCRLITVDAYNEPNVIRFYEKNNFNILWSRDDSHKTRAMYYDLTWSDLAAFK